MGSHRGHLLAITAIVAATVAAFLPVLGNEFVNWDDPFTLQHNERLAAPGVVTWAFTTREMGHYQPLAWLAWSLVKSIASVDAFAFHALSLLGHLVNAVLVYGVCVMLIAAARGEARSQRVPALAAGLAFAVHPMRVEVVAWASAFPYILSLGLLLVSVLAYLTYGGRVFRPASPEAQVFRPAVRSPRFWLILSICFYALSQLARASAIGFPLMLLAIDVYPFRRLGQLAGRPSRSATWSSRARTKISGGADRSGPPRHPESLAPLQSAAPTTWRRLIFEKLPFVGIALAVAVAESRARELATLQEVGLGARLTMAASAPFVYLGRTLLPIQLSPIDPLPIQPRLDWPTLLLSATAWLATTVVAIKARRKWPALWIAWLGYVLLLAPVLGLTPSGQQATADRYMYLPGAIVSLLVGAAVAAMRPLAARDVRRQAPSASRLRRWASLSVMATLVVALAMTTWRQTRWWHDSIALWTRAADLDPRNDIATYNLGIALAEAGREEEAVRRYEQTLALVPDHEFAQHNLNLIRGAQAEREGDRLAQAGDLDAAIDRYARVLALDSTRLHARAARGMALVQRARFVEAAADLRVAFEAAVRRPPPRVAPRRVAPERSAGGKPVLSVRPSTGSGRTVEGPDSTSNRADTTTDHDDVAVANALAFALVQTGHEDDAAAVLTQARARHPDDLDLAHNLARLLATASDEAVRDGALALRLALYVRDRSGGRDPRVLDTLAAAYAATGQFDLARTTMDEAAALARKRGDVEMAREIEAHARAYVPGSARAARRH